MSFLLKRGDENPLVAAIRLAVGATADEDVEVMTPTFNRPSDWLPAMLPPEQRSGWEALQALDGAMLHNLGCRKFAPYSTERPAAGASHRDAWFFAVEDRADASHELWLLPADWYSAIPNGFPLVCIDGRLELFERGKTDDDRRYGLLAYGLMLPLPSAPSAAAHTNTEKTC